MSKRYYRMPDGTTTTDADEYADSWTKLGEQVAALFPGYVVVSLDPYITLECHEIGTITGACKTADRFSLSPLAINSLLHKTVPPKQFRSDF